MNTFPYPDVILIIFAKAPVPGFSKTRLIPALGEEGAAQLQKELTHRCVEQVCSTPLCETQLWCAPDVSHSSFTKLSNKFGLTLHTQCGAKLGDKMLHAMSQSGVSKTIIIGTDIPLLTRDYIEQAIKVLDTADAVIGPAEDGGYVLLGLKKLDRRLFAEIDWGTDQVFSQTCEKLTASGLIWEALNTLWDVDNSQDLVRYKSL